MDPIARRFFILGCWFLAVAALTLLVFSAVYARWQGSLTATPTVLPLHIVWINRLTVPVLAAGISGVAFLLVGTVCWLAVMVSRRGK